MKTLARYRLRIMVGIFGAAMLATSCVSVAPQAETIRVTSIGSEVGQCKVLGAVESHPPYMFPSDGVNQLRNNAAALGADTLPHLPRGRSRSYLVAGQFEWTERRKK